MKKALEVLNRLKEQIVDSYTPPYDVEFEYTEKFENDIKKAFTEIEEAMKLTNTTLVSCLMMVKK